MNKAELKNFAVSARRDLLEKVALRAKIFGIDEKNDLIIEEKFGQLAINGEAYQIDKKSAFLSLKKQLEVKGYEQLIEEVAYTWFNRIIAIRYMEVNEYLPERVNVLSSSSGKVEPDILSEFETMDLKIDTAKIKDLIRQGETEDAYRKLFIAQCNALNEILPFMFEKIHDYTELLLPDFLLDSQSVINKLVSDEALKESFTKVEVIGWLYQFYNSEPKDKVFSNLQKNKKIEKYDIPAATQLFTPKWIVQYMVENSLGQLWLESNPNSLLKETMRYYIKPTEQNEEEVKQKLEEIRTKNVKLEEITIIDPCVGSGHILVYAFELLYQMYEEAGYPSGDIPKLIIENNLYGLDIDDRAVQLSSFALMMKAREKSRRVFRKKTQINIYSIKESNHIDIEGLIQILGLNKEETQEINRLIETFIDAKNYGSILSTPKINLDIYIEKINGLKDIQLTTENFQAYEQLEDLKELLQQSRILTSTYDIAITNPPYMGFNTMNKELYNFVKKYYPSSKSDLYAAMSERLYSFVKTNGFNALINQHSWMFLSRYEDFRTNLINNHTLLSMVHLGPRGFEEISGEVVQTTAYVIRKCVIPKYSGSYVRLVNVKESKEKEKGFFEKKNRYICKQYKIKTIPSWPVAYWISDKVRFAFENFNTIGTISTPCTGLQTSDNTRFLKLWHEISFNKLGLGITNNEQSIESQFKWFPYNKGGQFRRWYGNQDYVINWEDNGREIREYNHYLNSTRTSNIGIGSVEYYFKEFLTWSKVSSNNFSVRYFPKGFMFDVAGLSLFSDHKYLFFILGLLNSKVTIYLLSVLNPTMNYQVGNISSIPVTYSANEAKIVEKIVKENIEISKIDWSFYESSWEFTKHPFLSFKKDGLINTSFTIWQRYCESLIKKIQDNENELNRIFINLYGLENEINPEISRDEVTIREANKVRDSKTFLSYFIGCQVGRYSLNIEGLVLAGGNIDKTKYSTFKPNKYELIRLTDKYYFEDDVIARLREFLLVTFGEDTIEQNLQWLAESLELKRNETAEERLRRYFVDEFFKDHCQVYQKRPIYWLVDSGKQKGLRTLIYMHRYQPETMATIRFEHLQEIQAKYNNEIAAIDLRIVNPNLSATEKRDLEKRKTVFQKRLDELLEFDKKLAEYANAQISIDLDDGVKVNYAKFDKVLAKIK